EIAVARFGRMNEQGRRAGRGEGRCDLARDVAALADPGNDQPSARRGADVESLAERAVEGLRQLLKSLDLGANDAASDRNITRQAHPLPDPAQIGKHVAHRYGDCFTL